MEPRVAVVIVGPARRGRIFGKISRPSAGEISGTVPPVSEAVLPVSLTGLLVAVRVTVTRGVSAGRGGVQDVTATVPRDGRDP